VSFDFGWTAWRAVLVLRHRMPRSRHEQQVIRVSTLVQYIRVTILVWRESRHIFLHAYERNPRSEIQLGINVKYIQKTKQYWSKRQIFNK